MFGTLEEAEALIAEAVGPAGCGSGCTARSCHWTRTNATPPGIGYIVVRGMLIVLYLRVRHSTPTTRRLTTVYLTGFSIGVLAWIISLAVPVHVRPLLWSIGLLIEFLTPVVGRPWLSRIPVDTTHLPERIGQFTIILLGTTLTDLRDAISPRPEPRSCWPPGSPWSSRWRCGGSTPPS